jgi:hypothetical protein
LALAAGLLASTVGCAAKPNYVTAPAAASATLTEVEYLHRKATIGAWAERREALRLIGDLGGTESLDFLLERLSAEDDVFLRIEMVRILARSADIRVIAPLRHLALHEDSRVAIEAAGALCELGDDVVVPRLVRIMRNPHDYGFLSIIAAEKLKSLYPDALARTPRNWLNFYEDHRHLSVLETMGSTANWFNLEEEAPLPKTLPGSTRLAPPPPAPPPLEGRRRRTNFHFSDFWLCDTP